ncbi:MAG: XRE family transcriptional regulator [Bacteroidales bacterium]|nr:XRE family transcriptional regulator [Bacteroidales bacterium]
MDDHLQQVASRLRGLRDALELSIDDVAKAANVEPSTVEEYESGSRDIPVSFLHRLASAYGVELTALLFGEEPKMASYFVTRAGKGIKAERTKVYSYQDIAAGFAHRKLAPFIVTVEPKKGQGDVHLNTHQGHEFNYVLEGEMEITVGSKKLKLAPGDSIMFDASRPHGMLTLGDSPVKFLAIITN